MSFYSGNAAMLGKLRFALPLWSFSALDGCRACSYDSDQTCPKIARWVAENNPLVSAAHLPGSGFGGAQIGFGNSYPQPSPGLDHRVKEAPLGGDGSMVPSYMQFPPDQSVQQAHANTSYVSWDPGTNQEAPGMERNAAFPQDMQANPVQSQAQVDAMGLDPNGDPGLTGALDELMELDADFLDINLDDGTLFDGGIGEGDWSIGGF